MLKSLVPHLRCPVCAASSSLLETHVFHEGKAGHVADGVLRCPDCDTWYPIENGLLELVRPSLLYEKDLQEFISRFSDELSRICLPASRSIEEGDIAAQNVQRQHFDWYAGNEDQTYNAYQKSPFWTSFDALTFADWKSKVKPEGMLLDVGCADGRSCFPFANCGCTIVGFDISKALVRQAITRAAEQNAEAFSTFLVADASTLPFRDHTFNYVVVYGVLHHVPDPKTTCREVCRVLDHGGVYFGSENNVTVFRWIFDLLMKLRPIWKEEAGDQPLISRTDIQNWIAGTGASFTFRSSVFLPPQLVNLLGHRHARGALAITDRLFTALPGLRNQGGLNVFEVCKE